MRITILNLAEADLLEGFRFYEELESGIGGYFLDCLYSDIGSLRLFAGIHRRVSGLHLMFAGRFPYGIYYDLSDGGVRIWRVLDCRRSPQWIRRQLRRKPGRH